jgi:hypothetical protein
MSQFKHKKALMGAALLATAPAAVKASGGGSTEGSKSQRGVNHLTLEEAPLENITICVPGKSATDITGDFRFLPDKIAVVILCQNDLCGFSHDSQQPKEDADFSV